MVFGFLFIWDFLGASSFYQGSFVRLAHEFWKEMEKRIVFLCLMWFIWSEQRRRCFKRVESSEEVLEIFFINSLYYWSNSVYVVILAILLIFFFYCLGRVKVLFFVALGSLCMYPLYFCFLIQVWVRNSYRILATWFWLIYFLFSTSLTDNTLKKREFTGSEFL